MKHTVIQFGSKEIHRDRITGLRKSRIIKV